MNYRIDEQKGQGTVLGSDVFRNASPLSQVAECRKPEIDAQIESLNYVAGEIESYVACIEDRFSKVLQPMQPKDCNVGGNTPYHTALGAQLGEMTDRLRAMRSRLQSVLERAEL